VMSPAHLASHWLSITEAVRAGSMQNNVRGALH
jgi:hypothetical protein